MIQKPVTLRPRGGNRNLNTYIGQRLRRLRQSQGYTQHSLAQALNLSHQQVQKYETGANTLSAARLYELANLLRVNILYFYGDYAPATQTTVESARGGRQTVHLVNLFNKLDAPQKTLIIDLVKQLAGVEQEADHEAA
jgi:transcriptional regulator with XRE-family HTH domain